MIRKFKFLKYSLFIILMLTLSSISRSQVTLDPAGPFCTNDPSVNLTADPEGGVWHGKGIINSHTGEFNPNIAGQGKHEILYLYVYEEFTDSISIDTLRIDVFPDILAIEHVAKEIECFGETSKLNLSIIGGTWPMEISWGDGIETYITDTTIIEDIYAGIYYVSVIDTNGCHLASKPIEIRESKNNCLEIPNTFTPNDDEYNDLWEIENIERFPNAEVHVFNQWGQVVFKSIGIYEPWNGKYLKTNKQLPTGPYIYTIDLKENGDILKGIITIVR